MGGKHNILETISLKFRKTKFNNPTISLKITFAKRSSTTFKNSTTHTPARTDQHNTKQKPVTSEATERKRRRNWRKRAYRKGPLFFYHWGGFAIKSQGISANSRNNSRKPLKELVQGLKGTGVGRGFKELVWAGLLWCVYCLNCSLNGIVNQQTKNQQIIAERNPVFVKCRVPSQQSPGIFSIWCVCCAFSHVRKFPKAPSMKRLSPFPSGFQVALFVSTRGWKIPKMNFPTSEPTSKNS